MNRFKVKALQDVPGFVTKDKTYNAQVVTVHTWEPGSAKSSTEYISYECNDGKWNVFFNRDKELFERVEGGS